MLEKAVVINLLLLKYLSFLATYFFHNNQDRFKIQLFLILIAEQC